MREIKFRVWGEFPKYEVGSDGSVWSTNYNHTGERKALKQQDDKDGYKYVFLVINKIRYKRMVHRMVALCHIANPENKPQVNHKDGVRFNNDEINLEWVTAKENVLHGYRVNGRQQSEKQINRAKESFTGTFNPKAKINEAIAFSIRTLRGKGDSLKSISERYNISKSQVSSISNNKSWKI